MSDPVAVILAAGKGTRMQSELPKVVHCIHGKPMIEYVLDAAQSAGVRKLIVVVGYQANVVKEQLSHRSNVEFAMQAEQHGTGHAVQMAQPLLKNHSGPVLVLAGDTPLLKGDSLARILNDLRQADAACVIGTADTQHNQGLGRIIRDSQGEFLKITEERDATDAELKITEINTGCYAFQNSDLLWSLDKIQPDNDQAEYYLTDCPAILKQSGKRVIASCQFDILEAMGVNTQQQLKQAADKLAG